MRKRALAVGVAIARILRINPCCFGREMAVVFILGNVDTRPGKKRTSPWNPARMSRTDEDLMLIDR